MQLEKHLQRKLRALAALKYTKTQVPKLDSEDFFSIQYPTRPVSALHTSEIQTLFEYVYQIQSVANRNTLKQIHSDGRSFLSRVFQSN